MHRKTLTYTAIFSITLSLIIAGVFATLPANVWQQWQPATCLQTGCFCEAVTLSNPVRQPVNAGSSMAFAFAGIYIVCTTYFGSKRRVYAGFFPYMFGFASVVVGLGSTFYHASLTFTGQFFDILGMYLITSLMLIYALKRLYQWTTARAIYGYIIINLILTLVQVSVPDTRRYIFAVVLLVALVFEMVYRRRVKPVIQPKWLHVGLGLFAFAFFVWALDNTGTLCFSESMLQGHALWHLLGAAALLFLNRYYDSETPTLLVANPSPARA